MLVAIFLFPHSIGTSLHGSSRPLIGYVYFRFPKLEELDNMLSGTFNCSIQKELDRILKFDVKIC